MNRDDEDNDGDTIELEPRIGESQDEYNNGGGDLPYGALSASTELAHIQTPGHLQSRQQFHANTPCWKQAACS